MDWIPHQNPAGFSLEHPAGWHVKTHPSHAAIIESPDGQAFGLIQSLGSVTADTPADILSKGRFATADLFAGARQVGPLETGTYNSTTILLAFTTRQGLPGLARLAVFTHENGRTLFGYGSAQETFASLEPILLRIVNSFRYTPGEPAPQSPKPPPTVSLDRPPASPARASKPLVWTKFIEPEMGSFTMDVPRGWNVRGGFAHPMPGDRRPWVHAMSPEGISIMGGDPGFPQSFCHFPGQGENTPVSLAAGGLFLNIKPSAEKVADHYLKKFAPRRLGPFQILQRRPRPEVAEFVKSSYAKAGVKITRKYQFASIETSFRLNQGDAERVGSLLVSSAFNGDYAMGMWAFWDASLYVLIAPPELAAQAEEVRLRMLMSFATTPRFMEIYRQDELTITANAAAANAAQQEWFMGQQRAHFAQEALGDQIMQNYWKQQQANDDMFRRHANVQNVIDRLSNENSDAMLGRVRLADDAMSTSYEAPAGFNHYWLDQQSGQVVGTNTTDPPDYLRNYTRLRTM